MNFTDLLGKIIFLLVLYLAWVCVANHMEGKKLTRKDFVAVSMRKLNKIVKSFTTRENFSGNDSGGCEGGQCTFEEVDVVFDVPDLNPPVVNSSNNYTQDDSGNFALISADSYTADTIDNYITLYTAETIDDYIATDVSGYINALTHDAVKAAIEATRKKIAQEVNNKVETLLGDELTSLETAYQRHNEIFLGFRGEDDANNDDVITLIEDLNNYIEITTTEMRDLRNYIKDLQAVNKSGEHYIVPDN